MTHALRATCGVGLFTSLQGEKSPRLPGLQQRGRGVVARTQLEARYPLLKGSIRKTPGHCLRWASPRSMTLVVRGRADDRAPWQFRDAGRLRIRVSLRRRRPEASAQGLCACGNARSRSTARRQRRAEDPTGASQGGTVAACVPSTQTPRTAGPDDGSGRSPTAWAESSGSLTDRADGASSWA